MIQTNGFTKKHLNESHSFNIHRAKQDLKEFWKLEKVLLSNLGNYRALSKEYGFGEIYSTSSSAIIWDDLGHGALCVVKAFPDWRDYLLSEYRDELQVLVDMRSWAAYEILDLDKEPHLPASVNEELLANQFFFGDIETMRELRRAYQI